MLLDLGEEIEPWQNELLEQRIGHSAVVVRVPVGREAEAVDAVERGASAYLVGSTSAEQIATTLSLAAETHVATQRLSVAEGRLAALEAEDELIGHSPAMRRLMSAVSRAAENDATVLIEGKPGSGKTLVARCIHRGGRRAAEAFVVLQAESADEERFDRALDAAAGGTLCRRGGRATRRGLPVEARPPAQGRRLAGPSRARDRDDQRAARGADREGLVPRRPLTTA